MRRPIAVHREDMHPLDATLALLALTFGVVGLVLVALDAFRPGMVVGAAGVIAGMWGQYVSKNRAERLADVVGIVAAALAFGLGAGLGGLSFNG